MPLTATLDGERVDAVLATEEEWLQLKKAYKFRTLLANCGLPAYPRKSSQGLRHFVHKSGERCGLVSCWSETPQHRAAKSIVAHAVVDAGWRAKVEHAAEDRSWIADVLAEKGGRQIALEIQWSKQDSTDFAMRQERYADAGVECFWFVHRRNKSAAADAGVPHLVFEGDGLPLDVFTHKAFQGKNPEKTRLAEATRSLLNGEHLNRVQAKATAVTFELVEMACFACHRDSTVWRIGAIDVRTRCQQTASFESAQYPLWARSRVEADLYEEALDLLHEGAPLAPLRMHYSKTAKSTYLAYGCAHCPRGFFGDFFIYNNYDWDEVTLPITTRIALDEFLLSDPHSCMDRGFGRCSQDPQQHAGPTFEGHRIDDIRSPLTASASPDLVGETISMQEVLYKMTGVVAHAAAKMPSAGRTHHSEKVIVKPAPGQCDLCGTDPHPRYTCLWRRYRALIRVQPGQHHFSDDLHAAIADGRRPEDHGIELFLRLLERSGANLKGYGLTGSIQELEADRRDERELMPRL